MNKDKKQWEMRNITDENRVKETIENYKSLGFKVKVEDFDPEKCQLECNECMTETPEKFKVIFTMPDSDADEGLFDE